MSRSVKERLKERLKEVSAFVSVGSEEEESLGMPLGDLLRDALKAPLGPSYLKDPLEPGFQKSRA